MRYKVGIKEEKEYVKINNIKSKILWGVFKLVLENMVSVCVYLCVV